MAGILFQVWFILAFVASGITFVEVVRLMHDFWSMELTDIIVFIFMMILSVIVAVTSGSQDYLTSTGVQTYQGMVWALGAFYGMAMLDMGFAILAALSVFRQIKYTRGY